MMIATPKRGAPILLYNDECAVCRTIGHWVARSVRVRSGEPPMIVRPIGDDPEALIALDPRLDIWDAYDTIHVLMPDGTMLLGGDAVADVLRTVPATRWFAWLFAVRIAGGRPFQAVLNLGYVLLAGIRPLLGCESCGTPNAWVRALAWVIGRSHAMSGRVGHATPHVRRPAV